MGNAGAGKKVPFEIWRVTGITEHIGGPRATERLASMCGVATGQRVLDLGCGTGYSACLLAGRYGVSVVAMDLDHRVLTEAKARVASANAGDGVSIVRADAHWLPFKDSSFDTVMAESVLVFCDEHKVSGEAFRALRSGGTFGDNELTYLRPPPEDLESSLGSLLGVKARLGGEWRAVYEKAGFKDIVSVVAPVSLVEQLRGHLTVDGPVKYLKGMVKGLLSPGIMAAFFHRKMLDAAMKYRSYVGFGLYASRKP